MTLPQQPPASRALRAVFDLSSSELELFTLLFCEGSLKASELGKHSGLNRTSIYDIVRKLIERGLVYESLKNGAKVFSAVPQNKIELLIKEKEMELTTARASLRLLHAEYAAQSKLFKPSFQIFEGREELRQMMKDVLLCSNITVCAYWPIKHVVDILGFEFLEQFHAERVKSNIALRTIWPENQKRYAAGLSFLKIGPSSKREVRIAPKHLDFSLGYAVYENTVRFISSRKENMGFLVESYELARMMKGQFEVLWGIATPLRGRV